MITVTPDTELPRLIGQSLTPGPWWEISQERIDAFADATGDHQWLHVDPDRARRGPYGATIAHGFLLLSLLPALAAEVLRVEGYSAVVNYGLDRVRFPAPARSGARVRDRVSMDAVEQVTRGTMLTVTHTLEVDGQDRPACVAQQLRLLVQ